MTIHHFTATVKHNGGRTKVSVAASCVDVAIGQIMFYENCQRQSIVHIGMTEDHPMNRKVA